MKKFNTLEEEILILQEKTNGAPVSVEEIFQILSEKGWALIILLLSLPFCQPIQIPGFSTPFGLAIAFFALRLILGKDLWLPKNILAKSIPSDILGKITDKALYLIRKIKPWIHPRIDWMCHSFLMHMINALIIFIMGIILALPLPIPLSNLTAAWSIFFIALGVLEDDGVLVLVGYGVASLTFVFFAFVALSLERILPQFLNFFQASTGS